MTNLIEMKLKNLFVNLKTATNEEQMQNLFKVIEKECIFLQKSTLGRCKKASHVEKFSYIHIHELKKKYSINNLMEGCSISGTLFSELLGVIPQTTATNIQDRDLGLLDAFWLGLIPNAINNIILEGISKNRLLGFTPDATTCVAMAKDLSQAWSEIQDLIMAKAIGLHRIIGQISKTKEKNFRKIESNNIASQSSIKREHVENSQKSSTDTIQLDDKNKHIHKKPKLDIDIPSIIPTPPKPKNKPLTFCKGITCNQRNSRWCLDQSFNANKIEEHRKHCVRCSKFCTAMKQGADLLDKIHRTNNIKEIKQLQHIFTIATTTGINYASMMNSLEKCQRDTVSSAEAKYTKKTKILDRHKLICRILVHTYRTTPSSRKQDQLQHLLPSIATRIRKGITTSQILAKPQNTIQIQSATEKENSVTPVKPTIIEIQDSQSQQDSFNISDSPNPISNDSRIKRLQAEILLERNYISDEAITTAVEVLRQNAKHHNIFIAHGLANINILAWGSTQGWERFSRIFNSCVASFRKPNGIYIIPVFQSGHWYIIIVRKMNRHFEGWTLDSLLSREDGDDMRNRIQEAFMGSRGNMNWRSTHCFRQTECECGPRTIQGIWKICKNLEEGVSIDQSIVNASMVNQNTDLYESQQVRRFAAEIIGQHTEDMRSESITFRQRGSQVVAGRSTEGRKRKHKRG